MKLYFKTREQARQFASKANKESQSTKKVAASKKESLQGVNAGKWAVKL